jgi:hypothetical protein
VSKKKDRVHPVTGEVRPYVKVGRLTTTDGILTELRSVYRAMRHKEIPSAEGTKLTYVLKTMSEIMTLKEFERRLDCIESGTVYIPPDEREADKDGSYIDVKETH